MAKYRCQICGYIYDEDKEEKKFNDLSEDWTCPLCGALKSLFVLVEERIVEKPIEEETQTNLERHNDEIETYMDDIHEMAKSGKSIISAMGTNIAKVSWSDILILGAQLNPMPLMEHDEVSLQTVIGKKALKPMIIESPVYVTHMSFGALSKEAKIAMAQASANVKTAMCSGEGGILPEEKKASYKYIFEIIPNMYSVTDENLQTSDAIEIKIGQGTKPGMGGHLPGDKVGEEIALIRGKKQGEDIISPSKFENIKTKEDLKSFVSDLRKRSLGRPIGIKLAAGRIEDDLEFACAAGPDFITIDGRGGATGASPKMIKDATTVPTIYALHRARKYLDKHNLDIDLVITGGLRISSDFAKALAMGADAIAIGTAAMIAISCQQYRICQSGMCPMGIATQNEELRKRLKIEESTKRLTNYFTVVNDELKTFARITGHDNIHDLNIHDIVTISQEIKKNTDIKHA